MRKILCLSVTKLSFQCDMSENIIKKKIYFVLAILNIRIHYFHYYLNFLPIFELEFNKQIFIMFFTFILKDRFVKWFPSYIL
jgi:hypothetical protein